MRALLLALLFTLPAAAQTAPTPAADCQCGAPTNPRGPR
jgi:hypothetical protein